MQIKVDLSGRVDQTTLDSAMAFTDGKSYSVILSAYSKRRILHKLRKNGHAGSKIYYWIYCAMLFYLLKPYLTRIDTIILDQEYTDQEGRIKSILKNMALKQGLSVDMKIISTGKVDKRSAAHAKAIATLRDNRQAGKILGSAAVLALLPK